MQQSSEEDARQFAREREELCARCIVFPCSPPGSLCFLVFVHPGQRKSDYRFCGLPPLRRPQGVAGRTRYPWGTAFRLPPVVRARSSAERPLSPNEVDATRPIEPANG